MLTPTKSTHSGAKTSAWPALLRIPVNVTAELLHYGIDFSLFEP